MVRPVIHMKRRMFPKGSHHGLVAVGEFVAMVS